MPAFATDYFGATNVGSIYGLMLTAWGFAGVFGPMLIARIRQSTGHYAGALNVLAVVVLVSAVLPLITIRRRGKPREDGREDPKAPWTSRNNNPRRNGGHRRNVAP